MTDTAFYSAMDSLASELLSEFGSPATFRTVTRTKPNAQGKSEKSTVDVAGLAVRTSNKHVQEMFEKTSTVMMVVKFPSEPGTDSLIIHAGETWKIQEVKVVNPLGTSMIIAFVSCVKP